MSTTSHMGRTQASGRSSRRAPAAILALPFVLLAGCAGPTPVLHPNEHLRAVGQEQADQDIAECRELAEQAGASAGSGTAERAARRTFAGGAIGGAVGAAGGAVLGRPGTGAAFGAATGATAGLMRSTFGGGGEPSQAYRNVVDRCLRARGYEPAGWD
jgi:Glycine-zipper domain